MDDLISRAAVKQAFNQYKKDKKVRTPFEANRIFDLSEIINGLPAVDAVPVVRCRDCTYYDSEPGGDIMMCYNGLGWTEQNDFCSKGERRESE